MLILKTLFFSLTYNFKTIYFSHALSIIYICVSNHSQLIIKVAVYQVLKWGFPQPQPIFLPTQCCHLLPSWSLTGVTLHFFLFFEKMGTNKAT